MTDMPEGYDNCDQCGHARVFHNEYQGACWIRTGPPGTGIDEIDKLVVPEPCPCRMFVEAE